MSNPFFDFFTVPRMLIFFAGMATSCLLNWYRARHRGERVNWRFVGMLAAIAAMVFVTIQVVTLSSNTQACQQQLITAVDANKQLSDLNDELSEQQRKLLLQDNIALGNWINSLLNPPMPRTDPGYNAWALSITQDWYKHTSDIRGQLTDIQKKVDYNQEQRLKHPLPKPKCGMG